MSEYCQDRAILWLSRSFTTAPGELRDVCVEMAYLYEQMSQLSDRLDQLALGLDRSGTGPPPERPAALVAPVGSR